jgi:hypothetical protein
MNTDTAILLPRLIPPDPEQLTDVDRIELLQAGRVVMRRMAALGRIGLNLVGEVLKGQG